MARKATPKQASKAAATFETSKYNEVVGSARLLTIQLTGSRFLVNPEYYTSKLKQKLSFNYAAESTDYDEVEKVVVGRFRFSCEAKGGRKKLLTVSAQYVVMYEVHEGADGRATEAFCDRVGIFAAYPYFRALAAHFAWAANAKLPPLPVIATKGSLMRSRKEPSAKTDQEATEAKL